MRTTMKTGFCPNWEIVTTIIKVKSFFFEVTYDLLFMLV